MSTCWFTCRSQPGATRPSSQRPPSSMEWQPATLQLAAARSGVQQFWDSLSRGANLQTLVPLTRWDIEAVYAPDMAAEKM